MSKDKIRIKDIARLAGVSVGTVDRVLHNRGKVSDIALQKVMDTLRQIDYEPNLIARTLGSKKVYRIMVLLPDPSYDEYWMHSFQGIKEAQAEWKQYDMNIETVLFNLYDRHSFSKAAAKVAEAKPDGLLLAPVFYQEALPLLQLIEAANIPYVLFNTNIPEVHPLSFIGQDLYESGKLGAELVSFDKNDNCTYVVLHINEDSRNSVHLLEKEKGFKEYFKEKSTNARVYALDISNTDESLVRDEIENLLTDQELGGMFVTTSKGASIICSYLEESGKKKFRLVCYDLLKENTRYLQSGIIDFLINQNPKQQAFVGVHYLARHLLLKKELPATKLFPLEIVTRQNLNSYLAADLHQKQGAY
jgi:LacI family transcriptional regulator